MNNANSKLTYTEYRGCKDILTIDLHNGYTIIVIKLFKPDKRKYDVEFRITEDTVDKWELIQEMESVEFYTDHKTINKAILRNVSTLLSNGFFDYYIERYEYELKCFDKGNEIYEKERLGDK